MTTIDDFRVSEPATACAVTDCDHEPRSTFVELCEKHYGRVRRNGTTDSLIRSNTTGACIVCSEPVRNGRVYCGNTCATRSSRGWQPTELTCPVCNTTAVMRRSDAVFCSRRCTMRAYNMLHNYSVTVEQYRVMRTSQGGACAICRSTFSATPHIDHCHTTGVVRGLLCSRCNFAIGALQDDPHLADQAARYLRLHAAAPLTANDTCGTE